jgi:hypothetical protein
MTLQEAQNLVSQLGTQLGGDSSTYIMDENGESNLVFEGNTGVLIKHFENCLIVASSVAQDIDLEEPGLFASLMDFQFLGLRTYGHVLSWNGNSDTLLLSRHIHGQCTVSELSDHLETLLRVTERIREDLAQILDGTWGEKDTPSIGEDVSTTQMIKA